MQRRLLVLAVFLGMLLLPLARALVAGGRPLGSYFHFPPEIAAAELTVVPWVVLAIDDLEIVPAGTSSSDLIG